MMTTDLSSLKHTISVDMVVGPNVEAISDTPVIQQQVQTCHIPNDENCFGLPYQDHDYNAPPSKFPPISAFVKHGKNNSIPLNDSIKASNNMCMKQNVTLHPHRKNGEFKTYALKNSIHKKENLSSESRNVEDVTRCICGYTHDDGYMIACDKCKTWQHIKCMKINRDNIPDAYLCEICNPRDLNKLQAMQIQDRFLQSQADLPFTSELSSGAESGDDIDPSQRTYTAVQSTPTSLTITSNRTTKRSDSIGTGKKRKRSKDDNKRTTKKVHTMERKRSRSVSKGTFHDDEQSGACHWAKKLKEWNESYRKIDENIYTVELLQAVLSSSSTSDKTSKEEDILLQLRTQLAKVQELRSSILAMEDINVSQPIIELMGSYMLSNQTEAAKSGVFKRPYPYMFFYNGFDGLEVVVDSRVVGNVARYLRRSCCPNSEVRHVVEGNQLHLFVYSKDNISNGSEITIPFDYKYQNCLYDIVCACQKHEECPVYNSTSMRNHKSKSKDSDSGRVSPLRLSISRIHDQINGYPYSDQESHNNNDGEQANNPQENQRKKSREDRKVEAYVRAFARLEKKEKRKEQLHQALSSPTETKPTGKDNNTLSSGTIAAPKVSSTLSADDSATINSQPAKRTNRRRSTKGGRRTAKKSRMPSYEGVLSPSLSIDNDSNHSADVTPTTPDSHSMNAITEETRLDVHGDARSDTCSMCDDETGLQTSRHDSQSDFFTTPTPQNISPRTDPSSTNTNLSTMDCDITSTKQDIMSPIESGLIPVESIDELPPLTIECVSPEPPVIVSTSSSSKVAKKKASTTEASSGTNKTAEYTISSIPTPPIMTSFTNWEFCPGVPNGHIRVEIGNLPKKRHPIEIHIKKNWLNSAKEEGLISENAVDVSSETSTKLSVKKRFLKTYLEGSDVEKIDTTSNSTDTNEAPPSQPHLSLASQEQTVPLSSVVGTVPTQECPPVSSSVLPNSVEHFASLPRAYPAIEYESLSEDEQEATNLQASSDTKRELTDGDAGAGNENKMQYQTETYFNPLHLNGDMNLPPTLQPGNYERDLPQKHSTSLEDSQASAKKKVSLQEYWKRNKEQRKNTTTEPTETKSTPTTHVFTSAVSTSTPSPTTIQTPTSSISVISTPSVTSQPSSLGSSVATTPSSVVEQTNETKEKNENEMVKKEKEDDTKQVANKEESVKPLNEVQKPVKNDETPDKVLANLLSGGLEGLSPELKELIKSLPGALSGSSPNENSLSVSKLVESKNRSSSDRGSTKSLSTDLKQKGSQEKVSLTSIRPPVERSNSSPTVRQFQQPRQGSTSNHRKIGGSQHSSPSSRHSTPSSSGPRKGFTSPSQGASPRLIRGHSGSSISSPTPTIYDRRRRSDYSSSSRDSAGSAKSRHSSGASGDSSNNKSPKSTSSLDSGRSSTKHSVSGSEHKSSASRTQDSPQKVPSITPDVPGQPIPSLARGPGNHRVPQVVYNRLPSPPRIDSNPHSWDMHPHDSPSRSLKDLPFDRQFAYYRSRSPPPGSTPDRNSREKYFDRYDRPFRREDEPHLGYYHHGSHYPPDYRGDRPGYYPPPRDGRPPSPIPPSRPSSDYYRRSSSYYPSQDYRR